MSTFPVANQGGFQDECIDLKERIDSEFRIGVDPSYFAETGSTRTANRDTWLWLIRGARGHICPWGGELLGACLNAGHTILAKRLIREPWVIRQRSQVGDDGELNAVFHVDPIAKAVEYVKAYRRRTASESERVRLRQQGYKSQVAAVTSGAAV